MAEHVNEAELGRSKKSTTPSDHLLHLLRLGWNANSPLIKKYAQEHGLQKRLNDYLADSNKNDEG